MMNLVYVYHLKLKRQQDAAFLGFL